MSRPPDDETRLREGEETFVRRVADAFSPPEPSPARRAAFQAAVDARLRRASRRRVGGWMLAATAAAAVVLWLQADGSGPVAPGTSGDLAQDAATPEEAILAFVIEPEETAPDEALPDDYEAIAGVFLDG